MNRCDQSSSNLILSLIPLLCASALGCVADERAESSTSSDARYCELGLGECAAHPKVFEAERVLSSMSIAFAGHSGMRLALEPVPQQGRSASRLAYDPAARITDLPDTLEPQGDPTDRQLISCSFNSHCTACCFWGTGGNDYWLCDLDCD